MNWKLLLSLLFAILVFGLFGWLLSRDTGKLEAPGQLIQNAEDTGIPATARSVDGHAFIDESGVYLRSTFSTSTVKIPDADPDTFRAISALSEYGNQEILDFCKGPGNYGLYVDKDKTYLFQFWKTPTFSKTRIEVVKELNPDTLSEVSERTFASGTTTLSLGYQFATTSCSFVFKPI